MSKQTRYQYEKRIKELEDKVENLSQYKLIAMSVLDTAINCIGTTSHVSTAWIVKQFKQVMK